MDIEVFTLCDAATQGGGKLNILGSFNIIFADELPAVHPFCAVALKLRAKKGEEGEHAFSFHFLDSNLNEIMPPGKVTLNAIFGDEETTCLIVILQVRKLTLKESGNYYIKLSLNDKELACIPFYLKLSPESNQAVGE